MSTRFEHAGPDIGTAWRDAINEWVLARPDGTFTAGGREFVLTWESPSTRPTTRVHVAFECMGNRWVIGLDNLAAFDPRLVGEPFASLPQFLRSLTLKTLMSELIVSLPTALSRNLDTESVVWGAPTWDRHWQELPFSLCNTAQQSVSRGVLIVASPDSLRWLNSRLPLPESSARRARSMALRLDATVSLGLVWLHAADVQQLETGDLIWLETGQITRSGLKVSLEIAAGQHSTIYPGFLRQRVLTLVGNESTPVGQAMQNATTRPLERQNMPIETGHLQLPVTFDLGELTLSVAEIERLGPNYTFELPYEASDAVINVRVHGDVIARGTLVVVGRRLGVRLSALGGTAPKTSVQLDEHSPHSESSEHSL
jgi:type III secretion system YscQ/HrcQ family protein